MWRLILCLFGKHEMRVDVQGPFRYDRKWYASEHHYCARCVIYGYYNMIEINRGGE